MCATKQLLLLAAVFLPNCLVVACSLLLSNTDCSTVIPVYEADQCEPTFQHPGYTRIRAGQWRPPGVLYRKRLPEQRHSCRPWGVLSRTRLPQQRRSCRASGAFSRNRLQGRNGLPTQKEKSTSKEVTGSNAIEKEVGSG